MADELLPEVDSAVASETTGGEGQGVAQPADSGTAESNVPVIDQGTSEPTEPDEYADLYEPVEDEPAAVVAPAADTALTEALKTAGYADTPEVAKAAVQDAATLWQVVDGKKDAGEYLDSVRQQYPERFPAMGAELVNYLKWAAEKGIIDAAKLGINFGPVDPNAPKEDPTVAALRGEVTQMKTAEQQRQEAAQREQQTRVIEQTRTTINGIFAEASKGKWYEGDTEFHDAVLAQMDKNGVDGKLAQSNMPEWRKGYDKALKQVHNAELKRIAARSKAVIAHQARLRSSTPATPGQKGGPVSGKKSGSIERSAYPEGPDGLRQWQAAQMDANGWK
jgi:hypothetical protein